MIKIIHWPFRFFCWVGLHEYYIGTRGWGEDKEPEYDSHWECDVCGKRTPYVK